MFLTGYDGCFEPSYASESAAAIITMVLQHTDNGCKLFLSVLKHILPHLCSFWMYISKVKHELKVMHSNLKVLNNLGR